MQNINICEDLDYNYNYCDKDNLFLHFFLNLFKTFLSLRRKMNDSSSITIKLKQHSCRSELLLSLVMHIDFVLSLLGCLFNAFNVLIFSQILFHNGYESHMFKYLWVKAINDTIHFCLNSFEFFYFCGSVCINTGKNLIFQIWFVYLYEYAETALEITSVYLDIAAAFDCYITVNNKLPFCRTRAFFYIICIFIYAFFGTFCLYLIFDYKIFKIGVDASDVNATTNKNSLYDCAKTNFYESDVDRIFKAAQTVLRDVLPLIALVVLNLLLWFTIHQSTLRRKNMRQGNIGAIIDRAEHAEHNKMLMIACTGINFFLCHLPILIYFLPFHKLSDEWECLLYASYVPFYTSYVTPIFFYFIFNNTFKTVAVRTLGRFCTNNTVSPEN